MINIAQEVAAILGRSASPEQVANIAHDLHSRLELIVGRAIVEELTDQQVADFDSFLTADNDDGAREWLRREVPHYQKIVARQWAWLREWFVGEVNRKSA